MFRSAFLGGYPKSLWESKHTKYTWNWIFEVVFHSLKINIISTLDVARVGIRFHVLLYEPMSRISNTSVELLVVQRYAVSQW